MREIMNIKQVKKKRNAHTLLKIHTNRTCPLRGDILLLSASDKSPFWFGDCACAI